MGPGAHAPGLGGARDLRSASAASPFDPERIVARLSKSARFQTWIAALWKVHDCFAPRSEGPVALGGTAGGGVFCARRAAAVDLATGPGAGAGPLDHPGRPDPVALGGCPERGRGPRAGAGSPDAPPRRGRGPLPGVRGLCRRRKQPSGHGAAGAPVGPGGPAGTPRPGAGHGTPHRLRETAPSHLVPETKAGAAQGRGGAPGAAAGNAGGPGLPPHRHGLGARRVQFPRHGGGSVARPPRSAAASGDLWRRAGTAQPLRSRYPAPHGRGPGIADALSALRGRPGRRAGHAGRRGLPRRPYARARRRPDVPPGAARHPRPLPRRGAVPSAARAAQGAAGPLDATLPAGPSRRSLGRSLAGRRTRPDRGRPGDAAPGRRGVSRFRGSLPACGAQPPHPAVDRVAERGHGAPGRAARPRVPGPPVRTGRAPPGSVPHRSSGVPGGVHTGDAGPVPGLPPRARAAPGLRHRGRLPGHPPSAECRPPS